MKISMWMIANRLTSLEPEIDIRSDAPMVLKSTRLVYATDCVQISQERNDAVCYGDGGIIRLHDMDIKQAFEILQSVFDFYNDWNVTVQNAVNHMEHQTVINESWHIFHNPINLLDANNKVIVLSEHYGENDVNREWAHLCRYGYSSVDFVRYMKSLYNKMDFYKDCGARIYKFDKKYHELSCMSCAIYFESIQCGRIGVVEKDRALNSGDIQMLNYLTALLAPSLGLLHNRNEKRSFKNVFRDLIVNGNAEHGVLLRQIDYMKWKSGDVFQTGVIKSFSKGMTADLLTLVSDIIRNGIPQANVFMLEENIVVIYDLNVIKHSELLSLLKPILKKNKLRFSSSYAFSDLMQLNCYYKQAAASLEYGILYKPNEIFYEFYEFAMFHLIEIASLEEKRNACHPDVVSLWEQDKDNDSDKIPTLWAYLDNGLSVSAASQALFVHRNTLLYRIKKLTEMLEYDINDTYTRDYMKLSIKLLELYTKKHILK